MSKFLWNDSLRRRELPIDYKLGEILELSKGHQVVVVQADTGAGKTLRIAQAATLSDPRRPVILTQTRRAACRWNGKRMAWEMGCQPGEIVGWRLSGENAVVSRATRVTLCMAQSLVNQIRRENGRLPEGLLIIDEAHERSVEVDLLLYAIKKALPQSPRTRVIITSATIDTKKFSDFFDGAPVVSVEGRCYPVSTEVVRLLHSEHHSQGAARAAKNVLEQFLNGQLMVPTQDGMGTEAVSKGTLLVLLPGKDDIASVMRSLQSEVERMDVVDRVQILACHGESTQQEQDAAQTSVPDSILRIVCGTEILRSSVTVRDTIGVVDSLQVKRKLTDAKGVGHLAKVAVSRAEADQAKGRAGRTQPGFYMPCSFNEEYGRLNPWPQPAILREPIANVILQVTAMGYAPDELRQFPDAPSQEKIRVAVSRLQALDALDQNEKITQTGELLVRFPVDPERAKMLVTADKLGVLAEAVVAAAILEEEGIFHRGKPDAKLLVEEDFLRLVLANARKSLYGWEVSSSPVEPDAVSLEELPDWATKQGDLFEVDCGSYEFPSHDGARWIQEFMRKRWANGSRSDFAASVRAFRAFKAKEWELRDNRLSRKEQDDRLWQWCVAVGLNLKKLRMAQDTMGQIRDEVASSPLRLQHRVMDERDFDYAALTKAIASGHVDHLGRASGGQHTGRLGEFQIGRESACSADEKLVLVGGVRKIPVRRGHFLLADTVAPVEPSWLTEVMPQLCAWREQGDHRYEPDIDEVRETRIATFQGDLEIGRDRVSSPDEPARQVFAEWLAAQMV